MKQVLVKDGKVFAGPNEWNVGLFQAFILQDFGLTMVLPATPPPSNTNLGNDIICYDVVSTSPTINAKIQRLDGPFYTFTDIATQFYNVANKPLAQIKNELVAIIASNRFDAETAGAPVTIQGHNLLIDTTRDNRNAYLQSLQLGKAGMAWKLAEITNVITPPSRPDRPDGTPTRPGLAQPRIITKTIWLLLSLDDLTAIVTAIANTVQAAYTWESIKDATIRAAVDTTDGRAALDALVLTYTPVTYTATAV